MMSIVLVFRFAHTGYLAPDPARGPIAPTPLGRGIVEGRDRSFLQPFY